MQENFRSNFKFYGVLIILLSLWIVKTSQGELHHENKWFRPEKDLRPISLLKTAIEILNISSSVLNTLENHFGIEEYKHMLKVEEDAEIIVKELQNIVTQTSTVLETIESVGGLATKVLDQATTDLLNKFNAKKVNEYEKILEKSKAFVTELGEMVDKLTNYGVPLMSDLLKYWMTSEDLPKIYGILSKVGIELYSPDSTEITELEPKEISFDISILEKLHEYYAEIDVIEDAIDEVVKSAENEGSDIDTANCEKKNLIYLRKMDRYNIFHDKIQPLAKKNKEMLRKYNDLHESRIRKFARLSEGMDRSFIEILENLSSLKKEIVKLDVKLFRISSEITKYTKKANVKLLETIFKNLLNDSIGHEEL